MKIIYSFKNENDFLSNFFPCGIIYRNIYYPSVEHAYQASKSLDIEIRKNIASLSTSGKAKRAGKDIILREDWDLVKKDIMYNLLKQKFNIPLLKESLLQTKDVILIEGNYWHDNYWGICSCDGCQQLKQENTLGKLLEQI